MTCGPGVQQEQRTCTNPLPGPRGAACAVDKDGAGESRDSQCGSAVDNCPGNITNTFNTKPLFLRSLPIITDVSCNLAHNAANKPGQS